MAKSGKSDKKSYFILHFFFVAWRNWNCRTNIDSFGMLRKKICNLNWDFTVRIEFYSWKKKKKILKIQRSDIRQFLFAITYFIYRFFYRQKNIQYSKVRNCNLQCHHTKCSQFQVFDHEPVDWAIFLWKRHSFLPQNKNCLTWCCQKQGIRLKQFIQEIPVYQCHIWVTFINFLVQIFCQASETRKK